MSKGSPFGRAGCGSRLRGRGRLPRRKSYERSQDTAQAVGDLLRPRAADAAAPPSSCCCTWMEEQQRQQHEGVVDRQRLARCLDFFHRISSSVNGLALSVCFAASSPKGRAFDKSVRGLILSISLS